ncbi:hypothetical protein ED182_RS17250, partial [Escherichia coli]|nr:hypothetical protein [Escherichia coli]
VEFPIGRGASIYKIGDKEVSNEEFAVYEKNRDFHSKRMHAIWRKIELKNNIAVKMFKYFKLDEYNGFLEKRSAEFYEQALSFIKQKEAEAQPIEQEQPPDVESTR